MRRIVIVGAGGHGLVVASILAAAHAAGDASTAIGFVDDRVAEGGSLAGLPLLGTLAELPSVPYDAVIVAIGDNRTRQQVTGDLVRAGATLATAIHPFTAVASDASIGAGSMICAGSVIGPQAVIGGGAIINTRASVDHQSRVGDFAHVSLNATIGAEVSIGDLTLVAMGATVVSRVAIGARCLIGAGAVVLQDIADDTVAWGVPARPQRR